MYIYLFLFIGFIILLLGANLLINGSTDIAGKFNISSFLIGLTVVAFGTSAPEIFVNIRASFDKYSEIAMGNVLGSNIFNLLFIMAISVIINPIKVKNETVRFEIPYNFFSIALLYFLLNNFFIIKNSIFILSGIDGIVLLFCFFIFIIFIIINNKNLSKSGNNRHISRQIKNFKILFNIIVGLFMLYFGSKMVVTNSVKIAKIIGISNRVIGLTIIAVGTSLPELVTSLISIFKKEANLALGNLLGSNIFNLLFILGLSSIINTIRVSNEMLIDIVFNAISGGLIFIFVYFDKNKKLTE